MQNLHFWFFKTLEWDELFSKCDSVLHFTMSSATEAPSFLMYRILLFQVGLPSMMWSVLMQLLSMMISPMGCIGLKYPAVRLVYSTQRPFRWQRLQKSLRRAVFFLRLANLSVTWNINHCERAQWVIGITAGWNELKAQKGSLECTLLSRVRFNGADVNGRIQCWVYKNCFPEEGAFKRAPEPEPESGWLTPTREQLWGKLKAVERLSVCWFHHCALLCSCANSFPTLISSTVLMGASDNPI